MSDVYSSLITSVSPIIMNSSNKRSKIDRIIIHHNATTNKDVALETWRKGGAANTSAHYEVTPDEIIGCVGENYTAWHSGNWSMNLRSIGIEHVNMTGSPLWLVDERTLNNSAMLIADICKRYNIKPSKETIIPHYKVTSTACPGSIDVNNLIADVIKFLNGNEEYKRKEDEKMTVVDTEKASYLLTSNGEYTWISSVDTRNKFSKIYPSITMQDGEFRSMFKKLKG